MSEITDQEFLELIASEDETELHVLIASSAQREFQPYGFIEDNAVQVILEDCSTYDKYINPYLTLILRNSDDVIVGVKVNNWTQLTEWEYL